MSARDRRLRQAAAERDRQESETDESAFDQGLRQAAERQDTSRQVRPGRGTEERTVERDDDRDTGRDESAFDEGLRQAADRQGPSRDRDRDRRPDRGAEVEGGARDALRDIERDLQEASETIRREGEEFFGQDVAVLGGESFVEQPGAVGAAVRGAGRGLTGLADVPGTALGLAAGAGFAGARLGEAARGDPMLAAQRTQEAAEAAVARGVEAARERPVETGAALTASLVGSAGVFGAASAAGRGAGTATRLAIQPGEELIGRGGFAATRAVRGERAAERLFPMQEPLIFSEEAALRAGRAGLQRIQQADVRVRGVGAGVPALEVEFETETEPEIGRDELETPTLLIESERVRSRLENEVLAEFEFETETERVTESEFELRTELDLPPPVEVPAEGFVESELLQELDVETELEGELLAELQQEPVRETEVAVPRETETEVEVEPLLGQIEEEEEDLFRELDLTGVRTVEAVLDPGELDLD